jgi:hypothetical protein
MVAFIPNISSCIITLVIFFSTSFSAYSENTRIGVFTDKPFYTSDQIPKIFVSGVNQDLESRIVDIHVGLIDPSGRIYEYPDWNTSFSPWLPLFKLPSGFEFSATPVADAANFPSGIAPGLWHAGVALTIPGTLELLSVQTVPFTVLLEKNGVGSKFARVLLTLENDSVTLQGGFLSLSSIFDEAVSLIVGPQVEIEQCSLGKFNVDVRSFKPEVNAKFLDAGSDFIVTTNSGVEQRLIKNDPVAFMNYFTDPNPPVEFYQADETYTLTSLGGADSGSINASVIAPHPVEVSQPNLADPLVINSEENLALLWNGNDGIGEVIVTILGPNLTTDSYMIKCRFADDGSAFVPATLLKQLKGFTNLGIFPPELNIERMAVVQYRTLDDRLDYGFFKIRAISSTIFSFAE